MNEHIQTYIKEIDEKYQTRQTTEHSYRSVLEKLIKAITECEIINEAKHHDFGAPDLTILKNDIVLSFVETKDIDDRDLDGNKSHQEQFERYKNALSTIIFTDYLDFHLYVDGELKDTVRIAEKLNGHIVVNSLQEGHFISIIESLRDAKPQKITSASRLAKLMAAKARLLADAIEEGLTKDLDNNSSLWSQYNSFKEVLIPDLTEKKFADIYAQTIAYGLFAARINDPTPESFSRVEAATLIPKTNPFLRKMFQDIAGYDISKSIQWVVDDLVKIFGATDMNKVMKHFGEETKRTDPIVHFYEDFLSIYDPEAKKQYGVYYTPLPVVDFIVRAVDGILKKDFNIKDGLADTTKINVSIQQESQLTKKIETTIEPRHRVQVLDPATGTGTFLAEIIRLLKNNISKGMWPKYVEEHLIPRLHGFELMMAPYTIAHLKLDMLLDWWKDGTKLTNPHKDRLHIYLTNSLEQELLETKHAFSAMIAKEANEANDVKHNAPVMVVLGNPPYSGESQNKGEWITMLMEDYKKEPGGVMPLKERNYKWVNNDYCKFIRLAQDYVNRNNEGVLAYINANSFLNGITFRGMRWHLLSCFDKIYIINLHGSSVDNEKCLDGSRDENIFDIMQGVCINIFVKTGEQKNGELAEVFYADQYGLRKDKFQFLLEHNLDSTNFKRVSLTPPLYSFIPQDTLLKQEYYSFFSIPDLLKVNSVGMVSANDDLNFSFNKDETNKKISELLTIPESDWREKYQRPKDSRDWSYSSAVKDAHHKGQILLSAYKPFDFRYTYFTGNTKGLYSFPRNEVMSNLVSGDNIALVVSRQCADDWKYVLVSDKTTNLNLTGKAGKLGSGYVFPLYLYPDYTEFNFEGENEKKPNLDDNIWRTIENGVLYGQANKPLTNNEQKGELGFDAEPQAPHFLTPEQILYYIYGVLHAPSYREKYKEFLKIDFPRVPYPKSREEFEHYSSIGHQLCELHLMHDVPRHKEIDFQGSGSFVVGKKIEYKNNRVYINDTQYFDNVPELAWNFFIGGYQPAQKWLFDRKNRELSYDDIEHYQKIIAVLLETDRLIKLL